MPLMNKDPVNPEHYKTGDIECIDALRAALGDAGFKGFCVGNVIKYVWRYNKKNGLEDLKKAQWYLDRVIGEMGESSRTHNRTPAPSS